MAMVALNASAIVITVVATTTIKETFWWPWWHPKHVAASKQGLKQMILAL